MSQEIHTIAGKKRFIAELTDRIRDCAIERADAMPESWDGHEIREYLAELFAFERTNAMKVRSRRAAYKSTVYTSSRL